MILATYIYRTGTNFLLLTATHLSLNRLDQYAHRATLAATILSYAAMRFLTALRSLSFLRKIEQLEHECRHSEHVVRRRTKFSRPQLLAMVRSTRKSSETIAYIDCLFLAFVIVLCLSKVLL